MSNDTSPPQQQLPPDIDYRPPQPKDSGEGGMSTGAKWGIGCSIGCLLTLLIAAGVAYFAWGKFKDLVGNFVSDTPIVFVAPEADQAEIDTVVAKFDDFTQAMKSGTDAQPLVLTGRDVNLLIYHHPEWSNLTDRASIEITGDQLTGQVSMPLDELNPMLAGKYFNGKVTLRLVLANGDLEVYIDDAEMGGQSIPAEILTELKKENLMKGAQSDPELRKLTEALESLRVEDGKLIIVPKPAAERGGGSGAGSGALPQPPAQDPSRN